MIKGVTMTEPHPEFHWLSGRGPLEDIFCVSFVRGLSCLEVLTRLGVDESTVQEMTFDELNELAMEEAAATSGTDPGYVGAVRLGEWAVLVEPLGWRVPVKRGLLGRLSNETEVVSINRHDYADDGFVYAVDRDVMLRFDPLTPQYREGVDSEHWEAAMDEVGLGRRTFDDPIPDRPIACAFALARRITGVSFTSDVLDKPFLVAVANEQ
ncbi:DUF6461 domain-containing protein [Sphaerisporangium sp. TRM90804]|uniref:DUF6461 domain-containing protein n=1 Tax=Sphaerisporangium sp. TRM90804 TaxID=3031113 RepID=UPI00244C69F3|nr:DUF6461 domain-containing protein [Sphaerisporangium sp. TRM90804]MDH2428459.1 DUF6461 domain-containing protein [Sphaerisporangium sp. TRM90804]